MKVSNQVQVLAVMIFLSLTVSALFARSTPFSGYQVDFYRHFTALSVGGLVAAFLLFHALMYSLYSRGSDLGLSEVITTVTSGILLVTTAVHLPRIIGYKLSHGDPATHFQTVRLVITHGKLPEQGNILYPVMYTHIGSFSLITELPSRLSYSLLGVFYYGCIIAAAILLVRYFTLDTDKTVFAAWAAFSIIPFGWFPRTRLVGYLIGLLWIATVLRATQNNRWRLISMVLLPTFVLGHIFAALVTTLFIGFSTLVAVLFRREHFTHLLSLLLLGIIITLWITVRGLWARAILPIITSRGGASLEFGSILEVGSHFGYTLIEFINLGFLRLGVLILASVIAGTYFLDRIVNHVIGQVEDRIEWDYFSAAIPVFGLVGIVQFITGAINITGLRIFNILRYLTPLYLVYLLRRHSSVASVLVSIVILLSLLNAAVIYPNDITKEPSRMITPSDEEGVNWFTEHKSRSINQHTLIISLNRRYGYLLTSTEREQREDELRKQRLPEDADYRNNKLTEILGGESYIIINKRDRQTYMQTYDGWRYGSHIFQRIQIDKSNNQIYSNGNLNVYLAS